MAAPASTPLNPSGSRRISFAKIAEPLEVPQLLSLQTDSFDWLVGNDKWTAEVERRRAEGEDVSEKSGLQEIFEEISPIEDFSETMSLSFENPVFYDPKYSVDECKEKDFTYSAPLYVSAEFTNNDTGEIKGQTVFMGDFPLMTPKGTFVINGTERVVVSQLVRSPGVYFERTADKTSDKDIYTAKLIPSRGAWLEFEIDKRDMVGVRLDRKRKQNVTVLLKALGWTNEQIREEFGEFESMMLTLEKDHTQGQDDALLDIYRKLRPGEPPTREAAQTLLNNYYFNPKRYDLAKVGRYKINKKLGLTEAFDQQTLTVDDVVAAIKYIVALHDGREQIEAQNRALALCDQRFGEATRAYLALERAANDFPEEARSKGEALVARCVAEFLQHGDSVIRLLSEGVGERNALHPINVMVISLLLGRALGIQGQELHELGVAALIHDLGKLKLPPNLRQPTPSMIPMERTRYETHVGESVAYAMRMGLSDAVVTAIARHHEMADGSGFPLRLSGADLGRGGQVLALVNRYDRMCNPANGVDALTPHEALSVIFAQLKPKFDAVVLGAFIRMMGVYPPGSVVQLVNDRYAIVASVNSSRPLRPKVIVHDSRVPKEEAPILDLEAVPELGIRRSLKPAQLPRDALDYLSPRQRICYFFERAAGPSPAPEAGT